MNRVDKRNWQKVLDFVTRLLRHLPAGSHVAVVTFAGKDDHTVVDFGDDDDELQSIAVGKDEPYEHVPLTMLPDANLERKVRLIPYGQSRGGTHTNEGLLLAKSFL